MLENSAGNQHALKNNNGSNKIGSNSITEATHYCTYSDSSSNRSMEKRISRERKKIKNMGKFHFFYRVCNTATLFSIRAAAATSAPPSWSRSGSGAPVTAETKRAPQPFSRRGNQMRKDGANCKASISFFFFRDMRTTKVKLQGG